MFQEKCQVLFDQLDVLISFQKINFMDCMIIHKQTFTQELKQLQ